MEANEVFAFVRFLEDGVTLVTSTKYIKRFNPSNYDKTKSYKVKFEDGNYYRAHIICVEKSEELAWAKANKSRIKIPSKKLQEPDDEYSTELDEPPTSTCTLSQKKPPPRKNKIMPNYANLLKEIELTQLEPTNETTRRCYCSIGNLEEKIDNLTRLVRSMMDHCENIPHRKSTENEEIEVGCRRNDQIHLGRGVWVDCHLYDGIDMKKKHSQFIRELAVLLFGAPQLAASSVTGSVSNRTKTNAKPKLEPRKLLAIQDILKFRMDNLKETPESIRKMCQSVNSIISQKIQDLNRLPRQKKEHHDDDALNNNNEIFEISEHGELVKVNM